MKAEEREAVVESLVTQERKIMETKAREYATEGGDSLSNFKIIANILNVAMPLPEGHQWTPEHVLAVYWLKQILAALDNMDRRTALSEGLESRVLDARVYAACGLCLQRERESGHDGDQDA